jgi:hypothetical protein
MRAVLPSCGRHRPDMGNQSTSSRRAFPRSGEAYFKENSTKGSAPAPNPVGVGLQAPHGSYRVGAVAGANVMLAKNGDGLAAPQASPMRSGAAGASTIQYEETIKPFWKKQVGASARGQTIPSPQHALPLKERSVVMKAAKAMTRRCLQSRRRGYPAGPAQGRAMMSLRQVPVALCCAARAQIQATLDSGNILRIGHATINTQPITCKTHGAAWRRPHFGHGCATLGSMAKFG